MALKAQVVEMFDHAYKNYMKHAYPFDELKPISCTARTRDPEDNRGTLDDVFTRNPLTLIDSLDTLAILGKWQDFRDGVKRVISVTRFDKNLTANVFEINIRLLGGLLSAHLIAIDPALNIMPDYNGGLLDLASDLGYRMLPAFDTPTGIPFGIVNLMHGVPKKPKNVVTPSESGTLLLEMGTLSRLTGNPRFEAVVKKAITAIFNQKTSLNLLGNEINLHTGAWTQKMSGIGAGLDSFYEYLIKGYLLLEDEDYLHMFRQLYSAVLKHVKLGSWYLGVHSATGSLTWTMASSLGAFWPGMQTLVGDIDLATEAHAAFHSIWRHVGVLPEGFDLRSEEVWSEGRGYPLRPEHAESAYMLYTATEDPWLLQVGRDIVTSLQNLTRSKCGFASIADVTTRRLDDRMDSFLLSETFKYLYLLFSYGDDTWFNPLHHLFTSEGHPLPVKLPLQTVTNRSVLMPRLTMAATSCKPPSYLARLGLAGQAAWGGAQQTGFNIKGTTKKEKRNGAKQEEKGVDLQEVLQEVQAQMMSMVVQGGKLDIQKMHQFVQSSHITVNHDGVVKVGQHQLGDLGFQKLGEQQLNQASGGSCPVSDDSSPGGPANLILEVLSPVALQDEHSVVSGVFGPVTADPVEGEMLGAIPAHGCTILTNAATMKGKVCFVLRGQCTFFQKVKQCETAGALAAVVVSNSEYVFTMSGDGSGQMVSIMAVMLPKAFGTQLLESLELVRVKLRHDSLAVATQEYVVNMPILMADGTQMMASWRLVQGEEKEAEQAVIRASSTEGGAEPSAMKASDEDELL